VFLLDNSAWSRIVDGALDVDRAKEVADWSERRELATCLPFLLEAGYSARSAADYKGKMAELDLLPRIQLTQHIEQLALQAQRDLAQVGHHRLAPLDLVTAAAAHEAGAGVLHYDHDYDILASRTRLDFRSEWLAPPGTL
jgi:predicted nucleic acid-binding protein